MEGVGFAREFVDFFSGLLSKSLLNAQPVRSKLQIEVENHYFYLRRIALELKHSNPPRYANLALETILVPGDYDEFMNECQRLFEKIPDRTVGKEEVAGLHRAIYSLYRGVARRELQAA